jgi:RecA-family ATPase
MKMTIDNTCEPKPMSNEEIVENLKTMVFGVQAFERFNAKERETLDKAWNMIDQYEQHLKADMVAMLTELQLEIEEKFNDRPFSYNHHQRTEFYCDVDKAIQEKINSLKEA